jgi:hypothetical protein
VKFPAVTCVSTKTARQMTLQLLAKRAVKRAIRTEVEVTFRTLETWKGFQCLPEIFRRDPAQSKMPKRDRICSVQDTDRSKIEWQRLNSSVVLFFRQLTKTTFIALVRFGFDPPLPCSSKSGDCRIRRWSQRRHSPAAYQMENPSRTSILCRYSICHCRFSRLFHFQLLYLGKHSQQEIWFLLVY